MPQNTSAPANPKSAIRDPQSKLPLHRLRKHIIRNLATALAHASHRLAHRSPGQSPFTDPEDARSTLALLKTLSQILPHLPEPKPHTPRPLFDPYWLDFLDSDHCDRVRDAFLPPCPICHAAPGHHWVMSCPQKQPHHDLTALCSLQSYWARENRLDNEWQTIAEETKPSSMPPETVAAVFARLKAEKDAEKAANVQSNVM